MCQQVLAMKILLNDLKGGWKEKEEKAILIWNRCMLLRWLTTRKRRGKVDSWSLSEFPLLLLLFEKRKTILCRRISFYTVFELIEVNSLSNRQIKRTSTSNVYIYKGFSLSVRLSWSDKSIMFDLGRFKNWIYPKIRYDIEVDRSRRQAWY